MKKVSSLLCVFALLLVGVCNAETKTEYWPNGKKKSETNYKDSKKHGLETCWYENGQKKWEHDYKDGKPHGEITKWHDNGQKRHQITAKDGKPKPYGSEFYWDREGNLTRWRKWWNGKLAREYLYKDGKPHGLWTHWSTSGQKLCEVNYKGGKKHGLETAWHKSGQKKRVANYVDGSRHGLETEQSEDGKVTRRYWKNGKLVR